MNKINKSVKIIREYGLIIFFMNAKNYIVRNSMITFSFFYLLNKILCIIPNKTNLWVFGSGVGGHDRRGQNDKYLFLQQAKKTNHKMVWLSTSASEVKTLTENGYNAYYSASLRGIYILLRAEKVFCTNGMDFTWWLTGSAEIIQLWHGNGLKSSGWDLPNRRNSLRKWLEYKYIIYNWDYFITTSSSPFSDVQRRAFGMNRNNTLVCGSPRTDIFFNEIDHLGIDVDTSLLRQLVNVTDDSTVFMYAPTWRRTYQGTKKTVLSESGISLSNIDSILKEIDSYLILKMHPMESDDIAHNEYDRIFSADSGSDPYPLLKYTDCLITDYSSIFIDFLLLDRPIIFFPYDLADYNSNEGSYYKYNSITPGNMVENSSELKDVLRSIAGGNDKYEKERSVITNLFYDYTDGNSSQRVVNEVE